MSRASAVGSRSSPRDLTRGTGTMVTDRRTCYRCGQAKPTGDFIERIDDRHYRMCRACVSEILLAREGRKRRTLHHTDTHRTCYLCDRFLPVPSFTRRANGTYFSACKDCNRHVFAQRRRARLAAVGGSYTTAEWQRLLAEYDHCPGCRRAWVDIPPPAGGGAVITVDHIIAIAAGGPNTIANIQPLCYSCNSRKGHRSA